jgi:hypothetical protein
VALAETLELERDQTLSEHIGQQHPRTLDAYHRDYDLPLDPPVKVAFDSRYKYGTGRIDHSVLEAGKLDEVWSSLHLGLLDHTAAFLAQVETAEHVAFGSKIEEMLHRAHLNSHKLRER